MNEPFSHCSSTGVCASHRASVAEGRVNWCPTASCEYWKPCMEPGAIRKKTGAQPLTCRSSMRPWTDPFVRYCSWCRPSWQCIGMVQFMAAKRVATGS